MYVPFTRARKVRFVSAMSWVLYLGFYGVWCRPISQSIGFLRSAGFSITLRLATFLRWVETHPSVSECPLKLLHLFIYDTNIEDQIGVNRPAWQSWSHGITTWWGLSNTRRSRVPVK
ncbi:hypothetical protein B0J17DRAFT_61737 [Rhizoctonia solani]|nr:hypothetical protein B0J17DRAFT_61737 [Rhizoctonia solani]